MSYYKPTGFPIGRPRKGELRPLTPGAKHQREYRLKNKDNPEYKQIQAMYQMFWTRANSERAKELSRNAYRRKKAWQEANGNFSR